MMYMHVATVLLTAIVSLCYVLYMQPHVYYSP